MAKCGECLHFRKCSHYVTPEETFPEVGGCSAFKSKGDFVEVVRCKDCKMEYGCRVTQWLGENGFCSYGERKDHGNTV